MKRSSGRRAEKSSKKRSGSHGDEHDGNEDEDVGEPPPVAQRTSRPADDSKDSSGQALEESTRRSTSRDTESRGYKRKRQSDKPKHPLTAYNFFFREQRQQMLAARGQEGSTAGVAAPASTSGTGPTSASGKAMFSFMGKTIGERWRNLETKDAVRYREMADEDMGRYRREMEDYHQAERVASGSKREKHAEASSMPPPAASPRGSVKPPPFAAVASEGPAPLDPPSVAQVSRSSSSPSTGILPGHQSGLASPSRGQAVSDPLPRTSSVSEGRPELPNNVNNPLFSNGDDSFSLLSALLNNNHSSNNNHNNNASTSNMSTNNGTTSTNNGTTSNNNNNSLTNMPSPNLMRNGGEVVIDRMDQLFGNQSFGQLELNRDVTATLANHPVTVSQSSSTGPNLGGRDRASSEMLMQAAQLLYAASLSRQVPNPPSLSSLARGPSPSPPNQLDAQQQTARLLHAMVQLQRSPIALQSSAILPTLQLAAQLPSAAPVSPLGSSVEGVLISLLSQLLSMQQQQQQAALVILQQAESLRLLQQQVLQQQGIRQQGSTNDDRVVGTGGDLRAPRVAVADQEEENETNNDNEKKEDDPESQETQTTETVE